MDKDLKSRILHTRDYAQFLNALTETERQQYSQLKRFAECIQGDPVWQKAFDADPEDPALQEHLRSIGVEVDVSEFGLFRDELARKLIWHMLDASREPDEDPELSAALAQAPLVDFWMTCCRRKLKLTSDRAEYAPLVPEQPRFQAWQKRRIASAKNELGMFGRAISYPLFAYELSKGCSVRCWFCGFSAQKLSGVFERSPENRTLWLEVLQAGLDLFGRAASHALCYYGTEPYDNPSYLEFIQDFEQVNRASVCTSTAVPVKDPEWFRRLVRFYRQRLLPWPRVSVLSVQMLRDIHRMYSAQELRDVELLMQMRTAPRPKALSGRLLNHELSNLGGALPPDGESILPQGSIACVTGFLVNMVDRTIQLVSPCAASERWPYGYRVFATDCFKDATDYRAVLLRMVDEFMFDRLDSETVLRFRDDLSYEPVDGGFDLRSRYQIQHTRGARFHPELGALIAEGSHTFAQVLEQVASSGTLPFFAATTIGELFNRGLLDEVPDRGDPQTGQCASNEIGT